MTTEKKNVMKNKIKHDFFFLDNPLFVRIWGYG